ncbi:MAG: ABC transporter permease [Pseudobdellovibrionaceae bacterium]
MKPLVKIAFRNTIKNWRHSAAALISISTGFVSLVLFQGYIVQVERMYDVGFTHRAMYGHLMIENPSANTPEGRTEPEEFLIDQNHQQILNRYFKETPGIGSVVRFLPVSGMVSNGASSFIFLGLGYDLETGREMRKPIWSWDTIYGLPLSESNKVNSVVVGQALGALLGCTPVQKIKNLNQNNGYAAEERPFHCENSNTIQLSGTTESGQINAIDVDIVGLIDGGYKDIDERYAKMPLPMAQKLMNTDKIKFISLLVDDVAKIPKYRGNMNEFFKRENLPYQAIRWKDHAIGELYRKTNSILELFKMFIVTVTLSIAALSVLNTMVKIVKERTREIGTMRSLGFDKNQIVSMFLYESFFLSTIGVFIGLMAAFFITFTVNLAEFKYRAGMLSEPVLFQIDFDFGVYVYSTVLLSGIAVLACYWACRNAIKGNVVDNLIYA